MRRLKAVLVLVALLTLLHVPAAQAWAWGAPAWVDGGVIAWVLQVVERWSAPGAAPGPVEKIGPQMDPHG